MSEKLPAVVSDNNDELISSFELSIEKDNLTEVFVNASEFGLDLLIDNPIVKDIPIVGLLVGSYKVTKNIKDFRFAQKIAKYIYGQKDKSIAERTKFIEDFCESNQEHNCSILLDVIDRIDNVNKIGILCNLVDAEISGQITIKQFNRLIVALERVPFSDLSSLKNYLDDYYNSGETEILYGAGLVYQSIIDGGVADADEDENDEDGCKYKLSQNGLLLLQYGMKVNSSDDFQHSQRIPGLEWK